MKTQRGGEGKKWKKISLGNCQKNFINSWDPLLISFVYLSLLKKYSYEFNSSTCYSYFIFYTTNWKVILLRFVKAMLISCFHRMHRNKHLFQNFNGKWRGYLWMKKKIYIALPDMFYSSTINTFLTQQSSPDQRERFF